MKPDRRNFNIFSLSFLDVISCGFGAIVLLVLISKTDPDPSPTELEAARDLLTRVLQAESQVEDLVKRLSAAEGGRRSKETLETTLASSARTTADELTALQARIEKLDSDLEGLSLVQQFLKRAAVRPSRAKIRDVEVGGIPVDSDYVVFIIDTSGSMLSIWEQVVREVVNVITIHPKLKGFQIINDNGVHLISAYEGKWIPDTPRRRSNVINLFKTWQSASNSSPVEGLEVALRRYAKPNRRLSIYIFGDDYTGSSYDLVINSLNRLNTNSITGERLARVHAVGFLSQASTGRFATLMREVTRRNNGTFIALPR